MTRFSLWCVVLLCRMVSTLAVWVENPLNGRGCWANAMLDDGCTAQALVGKELAEKLGLTGKTVLACTEGVGGTITSYRTILATIRVGAAEQMNKTALTAQVMENPAGNYQPVDWTVRKHKFPHLQGLSLTPPVPRRGVEVMLGNAAPHLLASLEEVAAQEGAPVARRTALGWTVAGPVEAEEARGLEDSVFRAHTAVVPLPLGEKDPLVLGPVGRVLKVEKAGQKEEPSDKQLVKLVERMLEMEEGGEAEVLSPAEQYVVKLLRTGLSREGRQYVAPCTWRPGGERPAYNYKQAENRLVSLERSRHFRSPQQREQYKQAVEEWKKEGVIEKVAWEKVKYLIPHFPVITDSSTTPLRVVMDCKVKLNQFLLTGPNLINEVPEVLLRFRSGLYTLSGDVRKMFLRIKLREEDRPYHCFLWREQPTEKPSPWQFSSHVFGNAGSPCVAVFVLREHAARYREQYPWAVETLLKSTLIDDVLDSTDEEEEAAERLQQIRQILAEAGMDMAKFHSNSQTVLASLPREKLSTGVKKLAAMADPTGELSSLKTLGIAYNPTSDEFIFAALEPEKGEWTKRRVLKFFPRLFDPLGLLLPHLLEARAYFSSLHEERRGWDAVLPPSPTWDRWFEHLAELPKLKFPRCLKPPNMVRAELHVFVDASQRAYCAAAYLRTRDVEGNFHSHLVMAKGHVVPQKKRPSISRLELLAAALGAKLRLKVLQALKIPVVRTIMWTDSMTVLYWLHNDSRRLQIFVYNKVAKILGETQLQDWRYVPSKLNTADLPSRGATPQEMERGGWKGGPGFLLQREGPEWPPQPPLKATPEALLEMKKQEQVLVAVGGRRSGSNDSPAGRKCNECCDGSPSGGCGAPH